MKGTPRKPSPWEDMFLGVPLGRAPTLLPGLLLALALWDAASWKAITSTVAAWAGYVLAAAMAGVGLGTGFEALKGLGIKPFYVGLLSASAVGLASILTVLALGRYVAL